MRHVPCLFVLVPLVFASMVVGVTAQDASPTNQGSLLGALGLPELRVGTSDGVTSDLPAELPAGRYHLVLDNWSVLDVDLEVLQLPAGVTPDDYVALIEESESTLPFVPPDFFYEIVFNGGVTSPAGGTGAVVLDLVPGEWTVSFRAFDPSTGELANTPHGLTVTGEMPVVGEIDGAVDVSLVDMAFELPDAIVSGPQVWRVANDGEQVHHIVLEGVPDGTTEEQVLDLFMAFFGTLAPSGAGATPVDPVLGFDQLRSVFSTPLISAGQVNWYESDLEPGTYVMICFLPDPAGTPHFMLGMIEVFTVE